MIERQLVLPVPAERLWEAIADPEELAAWFGSSVEWELRPGAPARFNGHDGSRRRGRVSEVVPGRRLRFRWWSETDGPDDTSEVTYTLDPAPDGEGTRLVVTECPLDCPPAPDEADPAPPSNSVVAPATGEACSTDRDRWTGWDGRLLGVWALADSRVTAGDRR
ncbi:MAG: SRPBCC domain-containing protein [Actinomycetota bacterium]|nr:SRPBCC domain-containing protein [Actinomycetota bacterium]